MRDLGGRVVQELIAPNKVPLKGRSPPKDVSKLYGKFQSRLSRKRLTISDVTIAAPWRACNNGTPFRVRWRTNPEQSAARAKDETTSPTVLRSLLAIFLAAARTSSSMESVVRMDPSATIFFHGVLPDVEARVQRDQKFRRGLLKDVVEALLGGENELGPGILRDSSTRQLAFPAFSEKTGIHGGGIEGKAPKSEIWTWEPAPA